MLPSQIVVFRLAELHFGFAPIDWNRKLLPKGRKRQIFSIWCCGPNEIYDVHFMLVLTVYSLKCPGNIVPGSL